MKNRPTLADLTKWVKRFEHPSSDSTVVQSGCLVPRPSLADVSRIRRSNGKGNPCQGQFFVARFVRYVSIMDLYRSPPRPPATLNRNCWCRWFIPTSANLLMCTCAFVYFYALCISMTQDYLANFAIKSYFLKLLHTIRISCGIKFG